jgi:hypothetical protein
MSTWTIASVLARAEASVGVIAYRAAVNGWQSNLAIIGGLLIAAAHSL